MDISRPWPSSNTGQSPKRTSTATPQKADSGEADSGFSGTAGPAIRYTHTCQTNPRHQPDHNLQTIPMNKISRPDKRRNVDSRGRKYPVAAVISTTIYIYARHDTRCTRRAPGRTGRDPTGTARRPPPRLSRGVSDVRDWPASETAV